MMKFIGALLLLGVVLYIMAFSLSQISMMVLAPRLCDHYFLNVFQYCVAP